MTCLDNAKEVASFIMSLSLIPSALRNLAVDEINSANKISQRREDLLTSQEGQVKTIALEQIKRRKQATESDQV